MINEILLKGRNLNILSRGAIDIYFSE